jgi:hypothetical protein
VYDLDVPELIIVPLILQPYVEPPVGAVSVTLPPVQNVVADPAVITELGRGFTVT